MSHENVTEDCFCTWSCKKIHTQQQQQRQQQQISHIYIHVPQPSRRWLEGINATETCRDANTPCNVTADPQNGAVTSNNGSLPSRGAAWRSVCVVRVAGLSKNRISTSKTVGEMCALD